MKIAILSDSHRKTDLTVDALEMLKEQGAQYVIHAGDLEIEENLQALKNSDLTYVSVFGNNDHDLFQHQHKYNIKKEPYYFKIKDLKFKLMHLPYYLTGDTDIIVYGHTHNFEEKFINGKLFINPGELCARNKNLTECVLLEVTNEEYIINYYFKKPQDNNWNCKIISYSI